MPATHVARGCETPTSAGPNAERPALRGARSKVHKSHDPTQAPPATSTNTPIRRLKRGLIGTTENCPTSPPGDVRPLPHGSDIPIGLIRRPGTPVHKPQPPVHRDESTLKTSPIRRPSSNTCGSSTTTGFDSLPTLHVRTPDGFWPGAPSGCLQPRRTGTACRTAWWTCRRRLLAGVTGGGSVAESDRPVGQPSVPVAVDQVDEQWRVERRSRRAELRDRPPAGLGVEPTTCVVRPGQRGGAQDHELLRIVRAVGRDASDNGGDTQRRQTEASAHIAHGRAAVGLTRSHPDRGDAPAAPAVHDGRVQKESAYGGTVRKKLTLPASRSPRRASAITRYPWSASTSAVRAPIADEVPETSATPRPSRVIARLSLWFPAIESGDFVPTVCGDERSS